MQKQIIGEVIKITAYFYNIGTKMINFLTKSFATIFFFSFHFHQSDTVAESPFLSELRFDTLFDTIYLIIDYISIGIMVSCQKIYHEILSRLTDRNTEAFGRLFKNLLKHDTEYSKSTVLLKFRDIFSSYICSFSLNLPHCSVIHSI